MIRLLIVLVAVCLGVAGYDAEAAVIKGRIVDANDKTGLTDATVRLVKASRDSAFVAGAAVREISSLRECDKASMCSM